jgi:hypothetical protein
VQHFNILHAEYDDAVCRWHCKATCHSQQRRQTRQLKPALTAASRPGALRLRSTVKQQKQLCSLKRHCKLATTLSQQRSTDSWKQTGSGTGHPPTMSGAGVDLDTAMLCSAACNRAHVSSRQYNLRQYNARLQMGHCVDCSRSAVPARPFWDTAGGRRLLQRYIGHCNCATDIKEAACSSTARCGAPQYDRSSQPDAHRHNTCMCAPSGASGKAP